MKLNISIKVKNDKDPLTTSHYEVEKAAATILEEQAKKIRDYTVTNYSQKAIVDRNGNTTGYNIVILA